MRRLEMVHHTLSNSNQSRILQALWHAMHLYLEKPLLITSLAICAQLFTYFSRRWHPGRTND